MGPGEVGTARRGRHGGLYCGMVGCVVVRPVMAGLVSFGMVGFVVVKPVMVRQARQGQLW